MADNDALLAYLVSSFLGNTENVATETLGHILARSDASIEALNDVVQSGVRDVKPIAGVQTQVLHPDGTCPDMVGFDEDKMERVLIEVKFWAELTDNQPNRYLDRLPGEGPAVLMFLIPDDRIRSLWPELRRRVEAEGKRLYDVESERRCMRVGDTERHLMMVSWAGLLDSMAARSRDADEPSGVEADIRQLRNLARYADAGAFKPIRHGEEFGADSERRMREYQRLVDAAVERGVAQGWASRKGLNRTPRPYGFGRYVNLSDRAIVWFGINVEQFQKTGNTPLWVQLDPWQERKVGKALTVFGLPDGWVPVELKRDVEYPEMLEGVVNSLKHIAGVIKDAMPDA